MIPAWWSWLLTAAGVLGLWLAYAMATRQYGFVVSAVAYGAVYLRNWHRWPPNPTRERGANPEPLERTDAPRPPTHVPKKEEP